jgi:antitoxin component YwqK of YwqJK toxin-antitoxin module
MIMLAFRHPLAAQKIVTRYLDRPTLKAHKEYKEGRIPIYLQYYSQRWNGIAYYNDDTTKFFTGSFADSNATKPEGYFIIYNKQGGRIAAAQYQDGKANGLQCTYGPTGEVIIRSNYKDGLRSGPHTEYYYDGKVMEEGQFKAGMADSIFRSYHPEGTLATERFYVQGKLKTEKCFDEHGYSRNCDLFRLRPAVLPINFAHFYREYFTFSKKEYRVEDSIWYLQVVVDRDGGYHFFSLFKRQDGATGKLAATRTFQELLLNEETKLDAVGSLTLREQIYERLTQLPKAIPAYESNIAIPSFKTFEVWFK